MAKQFRRNHRYGESESYREGHWELSSFFNVATPDESVGEKWTREADDSLLNEFLANAVQLGIRSVFTSIAKSVGRPASAVKLRLGKLAQRYDRDKHPDERGYEPADYRPLRRTSRVGLPFDLGDKYIIEKAGTEYGRAHSAFTSGHLALILRRTPAEIISLLGDI